MNCMKEAEHKLRDYIARKHALESTREEIARLEAESTCVRSATTDSTPVLGGGNARETAMLNNIAARSELEKAYQSTAEWVRIVDGALQLLDPEERLILDRFYVHRHRGHAERLMEELHIEQSQVYRRKNDALRHFALVLYGVVET